MVIIERELPQRRGLRGGIRDRCFERWERGGRGEPQGVNCCGGVRVGVKAGVDADGVGKGKRG